MSRVIKSRLLRDSGEGEEYLVDPRRGDGRSRRSSKRKSASPEDTANSIISEARQEAETLIASAQDEAESIRLAAQQEGYQAGLAQIEAERQALRDQLAEIKDDTERRIEQFWTSIEPELLRLAIEIARKIVRRHIDENDGVTLETVKAGLRQLRDRQELKIRVNPEDYEVVRERKEDIRSSCDGVRDVEILDDRRVDKGGCLIECGNGHLDARIETQLSEVERALLEVADPGRPEIPAES